MESVESEELLKRVLIEWQGSAQEFWSGGNNPSQHKIIFPSTAK